MITEEYLNDLLTPYKEIQYLHCSNGFIAWRWGSGKNIELLYLYVVTPRKGTGTHLFKSMLSMLRENPPYATVFGFTRVSNEAAKAFYTAMGFTLSHVEGVYADKEALVFSANYNQLREKHNV